MTPIKDYYDILQVSKSAEQVVIEGAYKRLALKYHPDTSSSTNSTSKMQELNEAYSVLRDPVKRAEYDRIIGTRRASNESNEAVNEAKRRAEEERKRREEAENSQKKAEQENEAFRQSVAKERQRREKAEQELHRARAKTPLGFVWVFIVFFLFIIGVITLLFVFFNYRDSTSFVSTANPSTVSTSPVTLTPQTITKNIVTGHAFDFIPLITEMPDGFSEDSSSGTLPYANADGYSQIYRNPEFIQLDREVFVGYFTFVCISPENATTILDDAMNEIVNGSDIEFQEKETVDYGRLAKVDTAYIYHLRAKNPSGTYNLSYLVGIRFSNFINLVLVSTPVTDLDSKRTEIIRERLQELSYFYTSLVTNKLPLSDKDKIIISEPNYQRVPPTPIP
jgi:hypothetical protein